MISTHEPHPADLERSPFDGEEFTPEPQRPARPLTSRDPLPLAQAFSSPIPAEDRPLIGASFEVFKGCGGNGSPEMPVFGHSDADPEKTPHPFGGLCKGCLAKEPKVETKLERLWTNMDTQAPDGRWLFRGWMAVNCCDACFEEAKTDQNRHQHNLELWNRTCPTEFRTPWDSSKGNNGTFKRAMDWAALWNVDQRRSPSKGLVIHGESSTAKTRVCWHLYKKLAEEGVGVMFAEAYDILHDTPNEAFTVGVLIIDDLGNDAMDHRGEQRLLKLLRARAQWHRPFVVTTQFDGPALVARFKQENTGQAVLRRLREFCDSIHARKPGDGGIQRDGQGRAVMQ